MYNIYLKMDSKFCDFALISGFAYLACISSLLPLILLFKMQRRMWSFLMHHVCFLFAVVSHWIPAVFDNKLCAGVCNAFYQARSFGELVAETVSVCDRLFAEHLLCAYGSSEFGCSQVIRCALLLEEDTSQPVCRAARRCPGSGGVRGARRAQGRLTCAKKGKEWTQQTARSDFGFLLIISDSIYCEFFHWI